MISVIRCLVLHEVVWFATLNEKIIAIVVNIITLVLTILTRIFIQVKLFSKRTFLGYTLFLNIGIKIKKLSCFRFIPVTIGHLFMIAFLLFIFDMTNQNENFESIKYSLIMISLQFLYVVRQKDYVIELVIKCRNVLNNTVVPGNQDLEINDFGIFVGPQVISDPTQISDKIPSRNTHEFGGVYMG